MMSRRIQSELPRTACTIPALCLLLLATAACRPPNGMMRIVCVYGDVYLPHIYRESWAEGNVKQCWLANRTAPTPNTARDVLLCGNIAKFAWSLTWTREDVKKSLYDNSFQRQVNFHSAGHAGNRFDGAWWACK